MKSRSRIFAGTALGLLLAAPAMAAPVSAGGPAAVRPAADAPFLLAQAEQPKNNEALLKKLMEEKKAKQDAKKARKAEQQQAEKPEAKPAQKQAEKPQAKPAQQQAEKPAARKDTQPQGQAGQHEQSRPQAPATAETPGRKPDRKHMQTGGAGTPDQADDTRRNDRRNAETSGSRSKGGDEQANPPGSRQKPSRDAARTPSALPQAKEAEPNAGRAAGGKPQLPGDMKRQAGDRQDQDRDGHQGRRPGQNDNGRPDQNVGNDNLPQNAAPVLDSAKHRRDRRGGNDQAGADDHNRHGDRDDRNAGNDNRPPVNAGPPPRSDASAQDFRRDGHFDIESVDATKGRRIEGDRRPHWQRPKDADVVKEIGSRVIISLGGQTIVQSTDHDRLRRHSRDVYYEDLPHDRTRETIERADGSRVVTIRNEYGDVIRRSRFTPDGREIVLVYVDDRDLARDRDRGWRDPGEDLPPMRLTVPVSQYILDSEDVRDPDRYYEFLDQPPVEKVERLYSLGEVRRSARLRDKLPRVDLDTINFDTGSADISPDQVDDLRGVAGAMKRIIDQNPGETFLIEGHTDAVGDEDSNLALSDARASSVAAVLTDDFSIPSENLVTQGYGEEYLKVDTDGPERANRRVAIRRITPLVAPVAQAQ